MIEDAPENLVPRLEFLGSRADCKRRIPTYFVRALLETPPGKWIRYVTDGGNELCGRLVEWEDNGRTGTSIDVIFNPED